MSGHYKTIGRDTLFCKTYPPRGATLETNHVAGTITLILGDKIHRLFDQRDRAMIYCLDSELMISPIKAMSGSIPLIRENDTISMVIHTAYDTINIRKSLRYYTPEVVLNRTYLSVQIPEPMLIWTEQPKDSAEDRDENPQGDGIDDVLKPCAPQYRSKTFHFVRDFHKTVRKKLDQADPLVLKNQLTIDEVIAFVTRYSGEFARKANDSTIMIANNPYTYADAIKLANHIRTAGGYNEFTITTKTLEFA